MVPAFRTERISEHITRIYCFTTELCYLVEGNQRAALLDTGSGIGFIRPVIEQLTKKPLMILITHGHVDHAMGASEFPANNVYIPQVDKYIYDRHKTFAFRKDGLWMMGDAANAVTEADFAPVREISEYRNLSSGDSFDLGGISVTAFACPGHTIGSLTLLVPEERVLLTGDACNSFTFVFEDYSTSLEEYHSSLKTLKEQTQGMFDTVLASHGDGILVPEIIDENIRICESIFSGTDDKEPMEFRGCKGLRAIKHSAEHHGNIVYNPGHLR